jgi:hypothetical protein
MLQAMPKAKLMLKGKELADSSQRKLVFQCYARFGIVLEWLILEGVSPAISRRRCAACGGSGAMPRQGRKSP